jgi:hypothetical protein
LVAGTFLLWDATRRLWRSADAELRELRTSIGLTERQVNVAERHLSTYEDSVKRVERGYLFVIDIESTFAPHLIPGGTVAGLPSPSIRVVVKNHGRTPINIRISIILVEPHAASPDIPTPVELEAMTRDPADQIYIVIGPNKKYKFPMIGSVGFSDGAVRDGLRTGTLSLYCYGRITYRDIFMDPHETIFCRRYDVVRHEFVPDGGDERNYDR